MELTDLSVVDDLLLVRDHAADKLRNAIATGLYKPGARLIERELSEALGISRTSVREALRQLQAEKLITVGPRRRIGVAVLSVDDAADIYLLREMLEGTAVRRFVERNDEEAIKSLNALCKAMHKAVTKRDIPRLVMLVNECLEVILRGCGSETFYSLGMHLLHRVGYLRAAAMSEPGRLVPGIGEWDAIASAITERDGRAAEKAMIAHIRNSRDAVLVHLKADQKAREKPTAA